MNVRDNNLDVGDCHTVAVPLPKAPSLAGAPPPLEQRDAQRGTGANAYWSKSHTGEKPRA